MKSIRLNVKINILKSFCKYNSNNYLEESDTSLQALDTHDEEPGIKIINKIYSIKNIKLQTKIEIKR